MSYFLSGWDIQKTAWVWLSYALGTEWIGSPNPKFYGCWCNLIHLTGSPFDLVSGLYQPTFIAKSARLEHYPARELLIGEQNSWLEVKETSILEIGGAAEG